MCRLILHNLKKAKGQFASFGIVTLITAVILNTALVLLFRTSDAYDALFNKLNTANINVTVPYGADSDETEADILKLDGVTDNERGETLFASAALQDFQDSEFTMNTFFYRFRSEEHTSELQSRI